MKTVRTLALVAGLSLLLGACVQTTVYKGVKEIRHPDGSKTVEVTRSVQQFYATTKTESTKDAVNVANTQR